MQIANHRKTWLAPAKVLEGANYEDADWKVGLFFFSSENQLPGDSK